MLKINADNFIQSKNAQVPYSPEKAIKQKQQQKKPQNPLQAERFKM